MGTCLYRLYARPLNALRASGASRNSASASVRVSGSTRRDRDPNRSHIERSSSSSASYGRFFSRIHSPLRLTLFCAPFPVFAPPAAADLSRDPTSTPRASSCALVSAMICASPSARRTATSASPDSSRSAFETPYFAATAAATVSWRMNSEFHAARFVPASAFRRASRSALKPADRSVSSRGEVSPAPSAPSRRPTPPSVSAATGGRFAGMRWISRPWKMVPSSASMAATPFSGSAYVTYARPLLRRVVLSTMTCTAVSGPKREKYAATSSSVAVNGRFRANTRPVSAMASMSSAVTTRASFERFCSDAAFLDAAFFSTSPSSASSSASSSSSSSSSLARSRPRPRRSPIR